MKICKIPKEDHPKTENGCPLPLPPICAPKRKDCPTKEDLADCPKQPECAKTEKLCYAPPPPPPAGEEAAAPPKCPLVGKCATKDSKISATSVWKYYCLLTISVSMAPIFVPCPLHYLV